MSDLERFITESNHIEGLGKATPGEVAVAGWFMNRAEITLETLNAAQAVFAPGKPLRNRPDMNVRVGKYVAPQGGKSLVAALTSILTAVHQTSDPWRTHVDFEMLHPYLDGNGRTGRILWAWHMRRLGRDPFALSFLHRFYYDTLAHSKFSSDLCAT